MSEDEPSEYITYSKFAKVAIRVINQGLMQRSSEDTLSRAFKRLDTENKGFLLPDELRNFLTTQGQAFSNEEIEEMLTACTDSVENKIFYHDYAIVLSQ